MSKQNLFDFISEKENDVKDSQSIIYKDKTFDEILIPKLFESIKKCKKFKDLKYYQIKEITIQLDKSQRDLFDRFIKLVCEGIKSYKTNLEKTLISINGYEVILRRSKGEKLEEIGLDKGVSRERVRQIEKTAINEFYLYIYTYLQTLYQKNELSNDIFFNYIEIFKFMKNTELVKVIIYVLQKTNDPIFSCYDQDFDIFYNPKKTNEIVKIKNLIKLETTFDYFEAYSKINNTLTFTHNIIDFTFDIYKNYLLNKKYTFKNNIATKQENISSNAILSEVIKTEFSEGIVIDDEGISLLKKTIAKKYDGEVRINSALANIDETNPELIIWGKKKRIHIDNVNIKDKKLNEIIASFEKLFNNSQYLLLEDVHTSLEQVLKGTILTDKYRLYGVLKYYLRNKYYFKKMGVRKIELKDATLKDLVSNYIETHNLCTIEDIVKDLDISNSSAYAIIRDNSLIVCIDNKYTLATKLNIIKEDLDLILKYLEEDVNEYYIHKENFYNLHESDWKRIRITDDAMLYHICKYYFSNHFNFYTPYIQNKKYDYAISFKKVMKDYLEKNNYIIDITKAQKDLSYIISSKDFSLIYYMRSFDFKAFRMEVDRLTVIDNIYVDDITKYMIKQRLDEYFKDNKYAFEKNINTISKGLYYYVNDEKCYMNYYSLCSFIECLSNDSSNTDNLKDYYIITSLGLNNFLNTKYAIAKENISYTELVYKKIREIYPNKENSKTEVYKTIRANKYLLTFPNNIFKDYAEYDGDKIIFKN